MVNTISKPSSDASSTDLSGIYVIRSASERAKGRCLDADNDSRNVDGTKVQLWLPNNSSHQKWKLVRIAGTDNYNVVSLWHDSEVGYLDADAHTLGKRGTKIQLWTKNDTEHQKWQFNKVLDEKYHIICASPETEGIKYLNAHGPDVGENGGRLQLWEYNPDVSLENQFWLLDKIE